MKKIFVFILVAALVQPMSFAFGRKSTMDAVMNSWVGENINTVINHWGYPTKQRNIAGKQVYSWEKTVFTVGGGFDGAPIYGGTYSCNRILEVDDNYNVVKWSWNGNNCPITCFTAKKYVNPYKNPWN